MAQFLLTHTSNCNVLLPFIMLLFTEENRNTPNNKLNFNTYAFCGINI